MLSCFCCPINSKRIVIQSDKISYSGFCPTWRRWNIANCVDHHFQLTACNVSIQVLDTCVVICIFKTISGLFVSNGSAQLIHLYSKCSFPNVLEPSLPPAGYVAVRRC